MSGKTFREISEQVDNALFMVNRIAKDWLIHTAYCDVDSALTIIENAFDLITKSPWKPIDENTPYDKPLIFRTPCGNVKEDFIYDEDLERVKKYYTYYMEIPMLDEEED